MIAARRSALVAAGIAAVVCVAFVVSAAAVPATAHAATVTASSASPAASILSLSVAPALFSYRAVGAPRAARVTFKVDKTARLSVFVVDGRGRVVRTLMKPAVRSARWYRLYWNGSSDSGGKASDGRYRVKVIALRAGRATVRMRAVALDATPPPLTRLWAGPNPFWPDGDGVADRLGVAVWVVGERARVVTTLRGAGISETFSGDVSGTARYAYGGSVASGVRYGRLLVRARARDKAGNQRILTRSIYVSPYRDVASAGGVIRNAVLAAKSRGYATARGGLFSGDSSSDFHPKAGATRADLAAVLGRAFGGSAVSQVDERDFSDIASGTPLARYASYAVAKRWMYDYSDGHGGRAFRPTSGARTADVARAMTRALGFWGIAVRIQSQDKGAPWYGGDTVVMQDLQLRRRGARVHPLVAYPRGELAYSVIQARGLSSYRRAYVQQTFVGSRPIAQSDRQRGFTLAARRYLGEPYVWGGDALSEGGFDCSGLIYNVARGRGLTLGRTAAAQAADGRYESVPMKGLRPSDGVYFRSSSGRIFHAGMYLGDGYFIHSTGSRNGVSIDSLRTNTYWRTHFARGRRYVPTVKIRDVHVGPTAFSPDGDGVRDTVTVRFVITKEATVAAYVDDSSGRRMRMLLYGRRTAGSYAAVWKGVSRDDASVAPDGRYRVRIRAVDEEGGAPLVQRWVTLDTKAPRLISPAVLPNPFTAGTAATASVWVSEPATVRLEVDRLDGARVLTITRRVSAPTRLRIRISPQPAGSRLASAGRFRYRFVAGDAARNISSIRHRTFTVR